VSLWARVELLHGSYDAASRDPWVAEWPPHPARLFCALLASGIDDEGLRALRWLESQRPPTVHAEPQPLGVTVSRSYVVTNRVETKGGQQTHAGRKAIERVRTASHLHTPAFEFRWPDTEPDPDDLVTLQRLAKQVPYVGRSTSHAVVTLGFGDKTPLPADFEAWEPVPAADVASSEEQLTVPYAGYTDALLALHEQGGRAYEAGRERGYRSRSARAPSANAAAPAEAPHADVVILGIPRGLSVPGEMSGLLALALRKAVMSLVPDPLPATLSGHGADGLTHVAFLPLLDVGHPHARGHAMGVAIALPRDDVEVDLAIGRALAGESVSVTLPSGIVLDLERQDLSRESRLLRSSAWSRPATLWTSVTPIVLDRFPKSGPEDEIARACRALGLPDVVDIVTSRSPLLPGAVHMRRRHLPRRDERPRPLVHARIRFARPVRGPLALGAQRYLGVGLLYPARDREDVQ